MPKQDLKPRGKFDAKGRLFIPQWIRDQIGIKQGTIVEIEVYDGKILLTRLG